MRDHLGRGSVILADDTQREEDMQVVERWCRELPAEIVERGATYAVIRCH